MADSIHVQPGTLPWEPAEFDTTKVVEYHRYDFPLLGVIEQGGVQYLFQCLAGETEQLSFWGYTILADHEREELDRVEGDKFDAYVRQFSERPGVVAVAMEGYGLIAAQPIEDWDKLSKVLDVLLDDFDDWVKGLKVARETATRAKRSLPG